VLKSSREKNKMSAEAGWFSSLPVIMKRYIPSLWNSGFEEEKGFYQIEYFHLSTLSELYVFGQNELFIWKNILSACNLFLLDCLAYKAPIQDNYSKELNRLYSEKTQLRLNQYSNLSGVDLDCNWILNGLKTPSLNQIELEMSYLITLPNDNLHTIVHGDFCFSNILYDFRRKSIKVIDPGGLNVDGVPTTDGDIRYDLAKLAHSVIGLYDYIIGGYYSYFEIEPNNIVFNIYTNPTIEKVQRFFEDCTFGGMSLKEACTYPILVHLFLSMLPLHNDNPAREKALLANALRLYIECKECYKDK
jgi:hypothetical protein